ncbi:putative immunity protein [Streptomyces celluloflavus]|uniref:putative immunity protein n=1 Tax=Streptomyces celluloflavus TaxID=58344 RepID=UPI0036C96D29
MLARVAFRGLPYFDHLGDHSVGGLRAGVSLANELDSLSQVKGAAAAFAAARHTGQDAVRAAARAAATTHVARHAPYVSTYALTAARRTAASADTADATVQERDREYRNSPEHLRAVVFPDRGAS